VISNSRRTRGCATSQTTLLAIALLTFMGAGALWSVSGKAPKHHTPVLTAQASAPSSPAQSAVPASAKAHTLAAAAKLPIAFEPNQGQTDARTSYIAHGSGYGLSLAANEAVLALHGSSSSAAVHMQLEGASASPKITAAEPLPGRANYFIGNDSRRWVRNVPTFARVQYSAVYPGIDLVYYGQQGQLEYDFVVGSGADPRQIRMNIAGAQKVSLGADGSLRLKTPVRELRWNKPVVYQEVNGQRHAVAGRFELLAKNRVGFALGQYDRNRELIIDPVLAYTTYFGGLGSEINPQVAVDANSDIFLAGTTTSATNFPIIAGGTPPTINGADAVFISKLDPFASSVQYTTFLSGSGVDSSSGLAVDSAGNAYVAGTTTSPDFPVSTNAFQSTPTAPGAHAFLAKLDPTGVMAYSSYISGSLTDAAYAVAADNIGNAYVLGSTFSVVDFPTTPSSFQPTSFGATQLFFFSKINTVATTGVLSLASSSFLGGGNSSTPANPAAGVSCPLLPCGGITLDTTGNAYIAVGTTFTNIVPIVAFQSTNHGGSDAYVAKIKSDGTALLLSTYIGGSGNDIANAIAIDPSNNVYITGSTTSTDFPASTTVTPGLPRGSGQDAFVAKLSTPTTTTATLTFSSYLGGSGTDTGLGIAADTAQNAFVTGSTTSSDFPVPVGSSPVAAKGTDAFLAKLNTNVAYNPSTTPIISPVSSSALLGGSGTDRGTSIVLNPVGAVLVTGDTNSTDFPLIAPTGTNPFQTKLNTTGSGPNSDAFLATFGPTTDLGLVITPAIGSSTITRVGIGNSTTFTFTVTNAGPDTSTGAVVTIPVLATASGVSTATFTTTSGACAISGTGNAEIETCTLGTLTLNSTATIVATLTPTLNSSGAVPPTLTMQGRVAAGNNAIDPFPGNNTRNSGPIYVDYFDLAVSPSTQTVVAGKSASYTLTVTPHSSAPTGSPQFPADITPKCTPPTTPIPLTGTSCTFTPTPILPIPAGTGSATSALVITTTAPVLTAAIWKGPMLWYAMWLPISGLALLGSGSSRRRRWISGMALVVLLSGLALFAACGKKSTAAATTGTQPGTYAIQIAATSGTFTTPPTTSPLTVTLTVSP
jgi:Beta-propeller repeat/Domain of unknown function DUF11